jgi:SPP1 gp7 family putative phage head morphogenesis protein
MPTSAELRALLRNSANGDLVDAMIGHQVGLQRYGTDIVNQVMEMLAQTREDLRELLQARLGRALAAGYDPGPVTTARVAAQLKGVNRWIEQSTGEISKVVREELHDLSLYESQFGEKLLRGIAPINIQYTKPSIEVLNALVTKTPFDGKFYGERVSDFAAWQFKEVSRVVQTGMVTGLPLEQITRNVIGTPGFKFSDGVRTSRHARAQAATLARTSVNGVATAAREELYGANQDVIKGVQIIATLDGRTTLVCQIEDGKVYEVGSGPRPPFHYNCRTTTAPVLKSLAELAPELKDRVSEVPQERAMLDGVASGKTTYQGWMRNQNAEMHNFVLGPTRGRLFRSNPAMQLTQFADDAGRGLSLAQLVDKEADLFLNLSDSEIRGLARWIGDQRVNRLLKKKAPPKPKPAPPTPAAPPAPPEPRGGWQFFSPYESDESLDFDTALGLLDSDYEDATVEISRRVDDLLGLDSRQVRAVGDTASYGTEPSVVSIVDGPVDFERLRYASALKGKMLNQKTVLPFVDEADGPDLLYWFSVSTEKASIQELREELTSRGLQFRTLIPGEGRTRVMIYDPGSALGEPLEGVGRHYGATIHWRQGRGAFIGSDDSRVEAREVYDEVIAAFESDLPRPYGRYAGGRVDPESPEGSFRALRIETEDEALERLARAQPFPEPEPPPPPAIEAAPVPEPPAPANVIALNDKVEALIEKAKRGEALGPSEMFDALDPSEQAKVLSYIERARNNQTEYEDLIRGVAREFGMDTGDFADPEPATFFFGPLKKADRVAAKAIGDYNGTLDEVGDVLRMTYVVDNPADALKLYRRLQEVDDPVDFKNRMLEPGWGGYRDMILKVRLKDGMRAEVQINTRAMLIAKEGPGHKIYERLRVLPEGHPEWVKLNKESERLYGRAWLDTCKKFPEFGGCPDVPDISFKEKMARLLAETEDDDIDIEEFVKIEGSRIRQSRNFEGFAEDWKKAFGEEVDLEELFADIADESGEIIGVRGMRLKLEQVDDDWWRGEYDIEFVDEEGRRVARLSRVMERREDGHVMVTHDVFDVHQEYRGLGKDITRLQFDLYEKWGVDQVRVPFAVDVGAYAWPRYGWRTGQGVWDDWRQKTLERFFTDRLRAFDEPDVGGFADAPALFEALKNHPARQTIIALLEDDDPANHWKLADLTDTITISQRYDPLKGEFLERDEPITMTLGQALLIRNGFGGGILRLDDDEAMERLWLYVGDAVKAHAARQRLVAKRLQPGEENYWEPEGGWAATSISHIAEAIRTETVERGASWDRNGLFIGSYSSDKPNTITLPSKAAVSGGRHLHNHPPAGPDDIGGAGFSPGDIDTATWFRLHETRVVSQLDGQDVNYIARGFDNLTDNAGDGGQLGEKISKRLQELVAPGGDSERLVSKAFSRGAWGEEPSQQFGFALRVHHAMRAVSQEFGFFYEAKWRGRMGSLDDFGTLDDALRLAGLI